MKKKAARRRVAGAGLIVIVALACFVGLYLVFNESSSLPSAVSLDVPVIKGGTCRFTSRQMVLVYWINQGYISSPDIGSGSGEVEVLLQTEEARGQVSFAETADYVSWTSRGLFVCVYPSWKWMQPVSYTEHVFTNYFLNGSADNMGSYIDLAKRYLALGVPLYAVVTVTGGYLDSSSSAVNHAVVITGYNSTGFFVNNPYPWPSYGFQETYMPLGLFTQGALTRNWYFVAVFPVNYPNVVTTVDIQIAGSATIYTPWDAVQTTGSATVHTLKTGCLATVNCDLNRTHLVTTAVPYSISTLDSFSCYMLYSDVKEPLPLPVAVPNQIQWR